jgi:hypothetical protein
MLSKEWISAYQSPRPRAGYASALVHHIRVAGFIWWRVPNTVRLLGALVQVSLLLSLFGLVMYMNTLNSGIS